VHRIWQMNGLARVTNGVIDIDTSANGYAVRATGDINGDGNSDIVWDRGSNSHVVWTMSSAGRTGTIKVD
jgi:hypothetical protein